jgi:triosephosphate isomerase (TIM)
MPDRRPLIAGNWKMHGTVQEATALVDALLAKTGRFSDREMLIAPPYPVLAVVAARLAGTPFLLSAQDLHWEDKGAFTGEVSAPMIRSVGCSHVIVGHSERRQLFAETDEHVALKARAALRHDLTPIVCVGETLGEREASRTREVIERQTRGALSPMSPTDLERLVIAYEPVWAIGTGKVATPTQAQEIHHAIRAILQDLGGPAVAAAARILYGGSVKPDNVDELMRQPDVDGALVGGASLDADSFARIIAFRI